MLLCVFVCVLIHVRMSTREHWGAFRQHKASSSSVWSCWNSELEPAASSHISSATWKKKKKKISTSDFLLSASWTASCWPCHACTESMKSSHGPGLSTLNWTHILSLHTHTYLFSMSYYCSLTLVVVLVVLSGKRTWSPAAQQSSAAGGQAGWGEWFTHLVVQLSIAL